ncbi:BLUF domain-containing protein [Sulfitobacter sp. UBA1132]|uniref:BLUF domain-containing protein n=1 Tax=Sulfitobacter sp. UBA1132 TaxID=1947582 RepID=UPI00257FB6B6|nr:BLUF domain-containing protein [Sulfitobacter sp. UBA1132]
MVYQMAYVSVTDTQLGDDDLSDILSASIRNNERDEITGLLMYHDQLFFQVLEGSEDMVKKSYKRIAYDQRHHGLSNVWEGETDARAFPSWAMGYAKPDALAKESRECLISLADLKKADTSLLAGQSMAEALTRSVLSEFRGLR